MNLFAGVCAGYGGIAMLVVTGTGSGRAVKPPEESKPASRGPPGPPGKLLE